jgi:ankyrin repeat protein
MLAAVYDHHAIVQRLLGARADVNTKDNRGCALPSARPAALSAAGRWGADCACACASGRYTALHWAAYNGCTKSAVPLLVGGADQTITNNHG